MMKPIPRVIPTIILVCCFLLITNDAKDLRRGETQPLNHTGDARTTTKSMNFTNNVENVIENTTAASRSVNYTENEMTGSSMNFTENIMIDSSSKINYTTPIEDQDFIVNLTDMSVHENIRTSATQPLPQVPASATMILPNVYQSLAPSKSLHMATVPSSTMNYLPNVLSGNGAENEGDNEGGDDDDRNMQSSGDSESSGETSGSGEDGEGSGKENEEVTGSG
eukprot:TCONS_00029685-protein